MLKATSRIGLTAHLGIFVLLIASPSYALDNIEVHLRIYGRGVVDISEVAAHCDYFYQEIENVPAQTYYWEEGAALLQATGTDPGDGNGPYQFVAWYIRPNGPVLCTNAFMATIAYASQDVMEVDCIFARPRITEYFSSWKIEATGAEVNTRYPAMPSVTIDITEDVDLDAPYVLSFYSVTIGELLSLGPELYRILYYPDYRPCPLPTSIGTGDLLSSHRVGVNALFETGSFTMKPNSVLDAYGEEIPGEVGWDQAANGVGGGYPRHLTVAWSPFFSQTYPTANCVAAYVANTFSDDAACQDESFRIIGEQPETTVPPTTPAESDVDDYIDTLGLDYYPDYTNPTHYYLKEGDSAAAKLNGYWPLTYSLIRVPNATDSGHLRIISDGQGGTIQILTTEYVTTQLRLMLKKMHRQESASRQFRLSGTGWASQSGYPLWEDNDWQCTNAGCECSGGDGGVGQVGDPHIAGSLPMTNGSWTACPDCGTFKWDKHGGVGLYQLTTPAYRTRETIWNWKKNTIQACTLMMENFRRSCVDLDTHNPVLSGGTRNVFQPGLDLSGITFSLDIMRRLHAFNRFNGGSSDKYYWYNETAPSPTLVLASDLTVSDIDVEYDHESTDFSFAGVSHNVGAADGVRLCNESWVAILEDDSVAPGSENGGIYTFDWNPPNHLTAPAPPSPSFRTGDYDLCFNFGIYVGSNKGPNARIVDDATTGDGAGFQPPEDTWVKFGYVDINPNHGTQAYRDYNCDGTRDLHMANPYGAASKDLSNNTYHNCSVRYADGCEKQTDEH